MLRKIKKFLCLVLMTCIFYLYLSGILVNTTKAAIESNLVQNSGFENGTSGWFSMSGNFVVTMSEAYTGKYSLCSNNTSGGMKHNVMLQANTDYILTFAAKAKTLSDVGYVGVKINESSSTNYSVKVEGSSITKHEFQVLTLKFRTPASITSAFVYVWADSGMVFFDNISLTRLNSTVNPTTYYIDAQNGNDANNGTSLASAWKTLNKINDIKLNPGDTVKLVSGQIFSGSIILDAADTGTAQNPVTITTTGSARAKIVPNINSCGVSVIDCSGFVFENIDIEGDINSIAKNNGITIGSNISTNPINFFRVTNCKVANFGNTGIFFYNTEAASISDVIVSGCEASNIGMVGIGICANQWDTMPNSNVIFRDCISHDNNGYANLNTHSGNGIYMAGVKNGTIEYCLAYNNGKNNTNEAGPVGIWTFSSENINIQFCESFSNKTNAISGGDGGGFDLDMYTKNSTIQYCYSHNNDGVGFYLCEGGMNNPLRYTGNTIRYNISENDGRKNNYAGIEAFMGVANSEIYNNTVFTSKSDNFDTSCIKIYLSGTGAGNLNVRNNIFYALNGAKLVKRTDSTNNSVTFQGNCYWSNNGIFNYFWKGTTYNNLSSFRIGTGQETFNSSNTGLEADPLLVNPGTGTVIGNPRNLGSLSGYKLKADSPCINKGLNLPLLFSINVGNRDYYGTNLPQNGEYDIGAYESPNCLNNPGFENGFTSWYNSVSDPAYIQIDAYSGTYRATHWASTAYEVTTFQNLYNLPAGTYTLKAWVKSSGGQTYALMGVKNNGASPKSINIPSSGNWIQLTLSDIEVTTGSIPQVFFYSKAGPYQYISFDHVEFIKQ